MTENVRESILHVSHPGGHRASYRDLLSEELGYVALTGRASNYMRELLGAQRVLFATLDGDIDRFLLIAAVRSLFFRPTCGIFIGPLHYIKRPANWRELLRTFGLRMVKRLPRVEVLSIIPHPVRPLLSRITSGWIHDPQLWDLCSRSDPLPVTDLSRHVGRLKAQRKVVVYLGKVSKRKGLHDLVRLTAGLEQEFLVVVAGQLLDDGKQAAQELRERGMLVEDRFISDDELLSLYGVADYVWCVYPPTYDQASGVFGRAIQLGVLPVIRSGSVLDDYTKFIGANAVALEDVAGMAPEAFRRRLLERPGATDPISAAGRSKANKAQAIARLQRALPT